MRWGLLIGIVPLLASCYALNEADGFHPAPQVSARPAVTIRPVGPPLSHPAVETSRSVLAYHDDLRTCQQAAAVSLGSNGEADDVAALKRALVQDSAETRVSVTHRSDDPAVLRDRIVRTCLSKRGYALRG